MTAATLLAPPGQPGPVRQFAFELRLCAHLEATRDGVVSRQLGASVHGGGANRVMDVVLVEPGPEFEARTRLTGRTIPAAAIESDVGVGRWRTVREVTDGSPESARRVADRAVEAGFFERERRNGREVVRQVVRYPDWCGRLVGIENKPDLGEPGDLETQLRKDVALGLFDEVVLATESYVTGAHRNRLPEAVGIWRLHFEEPEPIEVVREPTPLATDEPGVDLLETHPARTDIRVVAPEAKARKRRRIAERAYGKGWRTYELPECAQVEVEDDSLPFCAWKGRLVDPASECGPACAGHEPADPPDVDLAEVRERRTAWVADPAGAARRQAGLDRFG